MAANCGTAASYPVPGASIPASLIAGMLAPALPGGSPGDRGTGGGAIESHCGNGALGTDGDRGPTAEGGGCGRHPLQ